MSGKITVLGAFLTDLACRTSRMPVWGETLHGASFAFGPGGKGANQAVAAARQGVRVEMITRVGRDAFGDMAKQLFAAEGIGADFVLVDDVAATGTATIIVDDGRGENAIIIVPGACGALSVADVESAAAVIATSSFFVSQLELDLAVCLRGMELAREANVPIMLNPAPAIALPASAFPLVSYLTPNETEAAALIGERIETLEAVGAAARKLRDRGVANVIITVGKQGVYVSGAEFEGFVPAFNAGALVDTTGAGDAFNGGFVAALSEGAGLREAARFGCAVAGISVTRLGTAPSMPQRAEVEQLLGQGS